MKNKLQTSWGKPLCAGTCTGCRSYYNDTKTEDKEAAKPRD